MKRLILLVTATAALAAPMAVDAASASTDDGVHKVCVVVFSDPAAGRDGVCAWVPLPGGAER